MKSSVWTTALAAAISGSFFGSAHAAEAGAPTVAAAPAMETLEIKKASGGLMDEAAGAGGYSMVSRTTAKGMMGKLTLTNNARFQRDGATPRDKPEILLKAKCTTKAELNSPLWSGAFGITVDTRRFSNIYSCEFEGQDPAAYAFEVAMPPDKSTGVTPGGIMTVQIQRNKAEDYANAFLARLVYKGKTYSAQPLGMDPNRYDTRMMKGFIFTRDGAPVGGVTFAGGARDKGSITAPAGSDDREAVTFLALALLHMPDGSSQIVQNLKYAPR